MFTFTYLGGVCASNNVVVREGHRFSFAHFGFVRAFFYLLEELFGALEVVGASGLHCAHHGWRLFFEKLHSLLLRSDRLR
jgi:hypothetical protein